MNRLRRHLLPLLAGVYLVSACGPAVPERPQRGGGDVDASTAASSTVAAAPAEIDLGAAMERARLSFRPEDGALEARGDAHAVRVEQADIRFGGTGTDATRRLVLGASEIYRGNVRLGGRSGPRAREDVGLAFDVAPGIEELLENRADAAEQSWSFEALPAGGGPPVVRVPVEGATLERSDARGLVLRSADGTAIRYSHGVFVDRSGRATHVAARFENAAIELVVDEATLGMTTFPAVLDPTISMEIGPTVGTCTDCPAFGAQQYPRAATGANGIDLVVYRDGGSFDENVPVRAVAQRISSTSSTTTDVLDAQGTVLPFAVKYRPGVAYAQNRFLVVGADETALRGARIALDGTLLDPTPFTIAPTASIDSYAVASDGTGFLVVYSEAPAVGSRRVRALRLSANGTVLDGAPIELAEASTYAFLGTPSVVWVGSAYAVLWASPQGARMQRLRSDGTKVEPAPFEIAPGHASGLLLSMDAVATTALATWRDGSIGYGVLVGLAGDTPSVGPAFVVATDLANPIAPIAAGSTFVVVYRRQSQNNNAYRTVTTAGALGAEQALAGYSQMSFVGAGTGAGRRCIFEQYTGSDGEHDIFASSLASPGTAEVRITRGPSWQAAPVLTASADGYALGWSRRGESSSDRGYAMRVSNSGVLLETAGIMLSSFMSPRALQAAALGSQYVFTYRSSGGAVNSARIPTTGTATVTANNNVVSGGGTETLTVAGGNVRAYYLAGTDVYYRDFFAGVSSFLVGSNASASKPLVAHGELVLYQGSVASSVTLASASPAGSSTFEDVQGIYGHHFAVGATAGLLVYRAISSNTWRGRAVLFDPSTLAFGTPFELDPSSVAWSSEPRVAFDGEQFLVVWNRGGELAGVRVATDGTKVDASPFLLATGLGSGTPVAITSRGVRDAMVAYLRYDLASRTQRAYARIIDLAATSKPTGQPCTSAIECATGYCVDGVCCADACGGGVANDCMACSAAAGGSTDGTCSPAGAGSTCRAAAGPCDVAETCDGQSMACPADELAPSGQLCAALAASPCESDRRCDGVTVPCPGASPRPSGTPCRPSAGECDVAETCDGASLACPTNGFASPQTVCRSAASVCDAPELCTGVGPTCPVDVVAPSTTVCRGAAGPCDAPELCTGTSGVCPPDLLAVGTVCRPAVAPCDAPELCNGSSTACPADVFAVGIVCRPLAGPCDSEETCTGTSPTCPVDTFATGVLCRAADGACDVDDHCDGSGAECPTDAVAEAGTVCRSAAGSCDVAESCTGTSTVCPADAFAPATQTCRPAAGPCDVADQCPGNGASCSNDARRPAGTVCRAARGPCDIAETCTGAVACPADAVASRGTVCRPLDGDCDIAETCSGSSDTCPADRSRVDGSSCSDGLVCNGDETCQAGECTTGEPLMCAADETCNEAFGGCPTDPPDIGVCTASPGRRGREEPAWLLLAAALVLLVRRRPRVARLWPVALLMVGPNALAGCVCGIGEVSCDRTCVDVAYDESNCGGCGVTCEVGTLCFERECVPVAAGTRPCDADEQCSDASVCNGVERCIQGYCRAGEPLVCDDGASCTVDSCSETVGGCVAEPDDTRCASGACTGAGTDGCQ